MILLLAAVMASKPSKNAHYTKLCQKKVKSFKRLIHVLNLSDIDAYCKTEPSGFKIDAGMSLQVVRKSPP